MIFEPKIIRSSMSMRRSVSVIPSPLVHCAAVSQDVGDNF
jgi:hypothetical protein